MAVQVSITLPRTEKVRATVTKHDQDQTRVGFPGVGVLEDLRCVGDTVSFTFNPTTDAGEFLERCIKTRLCVFGVRFATKPLPGVPQRLSFEILWGSGETERQWLAKYDKRIVSPEEG
jgi:hypothetical protein